MRLTTRIDRIEQAAQAKLQALLTPLAELKSRAIRVRRMLDYIGLPGDEGDGLAWRCEYDERVARRMLATGMDRKAAHEVIYAEDHGITEDEARERLQSSHATLRQAERDMLAGVPFEQSDSAARFREMIMNPPKRAES